MLLSYLQDDLTFKHHCDTNFPTDAVQNNLFFIAFITLSRKRKEKQYQRVIYITLDFTAAWHCE